METRKVQKIGGSSFSLILPKKWANSVNLKSKDELNLINKSPTSLLITTKKTSRRFKRKIDVHSLEPKEVQREVVALFVLGYEEIEITADILTTDQKKKVKRIVRYLSGMDITEESSNALILKNLLDPEKFNFIESLKKMFFMSRLMLADAFNAFVSGNQSLAEDVAERDLEIDKIYFLILRVYHSMLLDKIAEEQVNANLLTADYYQNLAGQLERIADHAVKIALLPQSKNFKPEKALEKSIRTLYSNVENSLKRAEECFKQPSKEKAHTLLRELGESKTQRIKLHEEITKLNQSSIMILHDSLDRISNYLINIGEYALDISMETEQDKA